MTEQPQRSQLELYAQVIAAYQRAGFWPLFKHAYMVSGKKWRTNGWFWITLIVLAVILWMTLASISNCFYPDTAIWFQLAFFSCYLLVLILIFKDLNKKIQHAFKEDMKKYGSLAKIYEEGRELSRYFLFRVTLRDYNISKKDIESVNHLFQIDQQSLGSYVAQKSSIIWIVSTLTAVLAASATIWSFQFVFMFFSLD